MGSCISLLPNSTTSLNHSLVLPMSKCMFLYYYVAEFRMLPDLSACEALRLSQKLHCNPLTQKVFTCWMWSMSSLQYMTYLSKAAILSNLHELLLCFTVHTCSRMLTSTSHLRINSRSTNLLETMQRWMTSKMKLNPKRYVEPTQCFKCSTRNYKLNL